MKSIRLELNLWEELADFQQLLDGVEAIVSHLPELQQLQVAGDALLRIAELCESRVELLMTGWEESDRDPIVGQGFFGEMVRQTMAVDLSELMAPAPLRKPRTRTNKPTGSIVATVEKQAVLAMVEQLVEMEAEMQKQAVLGVAHSENVSGWTKAIALWLRQQSSEVSWRELETGLGMPWVELWLGLLLGGFRVEQRGVLSAGDDLGRGDEGISREEVSCSISRFIIVHFNVTFNSSIMNRILRISFALRV